MAFSSLSFRSSSALAPSFGSGPPSSSSLGGFRMSSLSSKASSSAPMGHKFKDEDSAVGYPFIEMVATHHDYGHMMQSTVHYEVHLVHGTIKLTKLHWYLLVKMKNSNYPSITFEVTTSNMTNLIQTTRNVRPDGVWKGLLSKDPEYIDTYVGTLHDICCLADEVVADMDTYHLTRNNCQNFCNKLLIKMKVRNTPFPTTFHEGTTKPDDEQSIFDSFRVVLHKVLNAGPDALATAGATVLATIVGAPIPHIPDRQSDLKRIKQILDPLTSKWKEIGMQLNITKEALNKIETENGGQLSPCLREMLREHLVHVDSYEALADVIEKYNKPLSVKIRRLIPDGQAPQQGIN